MVVGAAHENNVWKLFSCSTFFLFGGVCESLEYQVRFKVVQNLVVSKVRIFRKVKNWLVLNIFIIFIVVDFNKSLSDEKHFFDITLVTNHSFSRILNSAEHVDDHLISKSSFAFFKKVIE